MSSAGDLLRAAEARLRAAGVADTPLLDAELLLCEASGMTRERLVARPEDRVAPDASRRFEALLARREAREPIAYILGRRAFRWIELEVTPDVLIPRPETELLVEIALAELTSAGGRNGPNLTSVPPRALDIGTGSGAVALAIAHEAPRAAVTAMDTSTQALVVARRNAKRLGLTERVEFTEGTIPPKQFDLILANLPYVPTADLNALAPELSYEPRHALDGGPDGLDVIREVIPQAMAVLAPGGTLALEVGEGQAPDVARLLESASLTAPTTHRDLAGIERVVTARRSSAA